MIKRPPRQILLIKGSRLCEVCCSNTWTQLKECVLRHWPAAKCGGFKLDIGTKHISKPMLFPGNEGRSLFRIFYPSPYLASGLGG